MFSGIFIMTGDYHIIPA